MKRMKFFRIIIITLSMAMLLSSCSYFSSDRARFGGGELLDDERISEIKAELFSDTETGTSSAQSTDEDNGQIPDDTEKGHNNSEETEIKNETPTNNEIQSSSVENDNTAEHVTEGNEQDGNEESSSQNSDEGEDSAQDDNEESFTQGGEEDDSEQGSEEESVVYWTEGGSVWHVSKECSSLKNSKNIISGSVEEAQNAGKERVCSRCGKE